MSMRVTASIVIFKNDPVVLERAIRSYLRDEPEGTLYLIDNSPRPTEEEFIHHPRIVYRFNGRNVGFGKGHNLALSLSLQQGAAYHIVLNPDIYFDAGVVPGLTALMDRHPEIGLAMPKVFYPNGQLQNLCKLLPTPRLLFVRHFLRFSPAILKKENHEYELRFSGYDRLMDVPFLSGCFMFLRNEALKKVGLFDERIFLYTEDIDLTRRIHRHFRTVFFPDVSIYHVHERGSYKNFRSFLHHIRSAITYFNKWGWFHDPERDVINRNTLLRLSR
jgi:GT2 family glycosyltransferase